MFGRYSAFLSKSFASVPQIRNRPDHHFYITEKASFNFPRFLREDRRHSYINPVAFFFLSKVLSENYLKLRKLNKASKLSVAPSIFDWAGERTLIRPVFDVKDAQKRQINARFEVIAEADISAFYHSIYTHAIAWAIHDKAFAKQNRTVIHVGNLIDLLVRNAQDGQTIGIPVGPDTSRLIAEVVGTAIDRSIQKSLDKFMKKKSSNRNAIRFIDDYTFGCSSVQEAETVIASVRGAVNSFELELNNSKTKIQTVRSVLNIGWREHLREYLPKAPYSGDALSRYFYNVYVTARENETNNVVKFALQIARRAFLSTEHWLIVEDYLISAYRQNSTLINLMVELFILREINRGDVSRELLQDFLSSRIPLLIGMQRNGEVIWLLFLCVALKLPLASSVVDCLFNVEDGAIAVLVADLFRLDLVAGACDYSVWNNSLSQGGLDGSMWLYAYKSALKNLNGAGATSHVTGHKYFRFLLSKRIEFYRSGSEHIATNDIFRSLRIDNLRRRLVEERLNVDLGEGVDDFDDWNFDEQDDDDSVSDVY